MRRLIRYNTGRSFLTALLFVAVAGCSSTESFEEPAPVPDIVASVEFEEVWDRSVGDGHDDKLLFLEPALFDGTLYAISFDGELQALDPLTGEEKWEIDTDRRIMAGLGVDQNHLYVVTRSGELVALDRSTGKPRWNQTLPSEAVARPTSNGETVVVHTIDGSASAFLADSGEKQWQFDGQIPVLSFRGNATPVVGADLTLVAFASGRLVALETDSGEVAWDYRIGEPVGRTELERLVDVDASPMVQNGVVYIAGYQGQAVALDRDSGRELWSREVSSLKQPALAYSNVFVAAHDGKVKAYSLNSRKELWVQDALAWRRLTRPVTVDGYLVLGDFEGYLHVLSQLDGTLQGQIEVDGDGLRSPMLKVEDLLIVYGNSGELVAYRLREQE